MHTFEGHKRFVNSVAFSPDGTQILTGSWDLTARLWNISDGQVLRTFGGHGGFVNSVIFSHDGNKIITVSGDRTARLWEVDGEGFEPPPPREIISLALGETVESDITRFAWRDYSFEVDAGRSVVVEVTPLANMSSLNLYSRFGSSTGVYDQWTREPTARGTYELLISPTQSGTYYLGVFGREMTSSSGTFRITARAVETHFSDVTPRSAGNVGPVTLQLSGLGIVDGMSVELRRAGSSIQADTVTRLSDRSLSARFELNGATLGTYDIRAIWPDGHTETLNSAFEVQLGRGPELTANLVLPEANRRERTYTAWVHYANTGDANMPAPLFVLSSEQSAPIKTPCDTGWRTGSVQLLGVNPNGPADVLPPGAEGKVSASFQGIGEHITFDLHAVEASNMPVNWSEYKASMRPSAIPTDEWDRLWPTLTTRLGNSWAEYLGLLGRHAEGLREQGLVNYCVADLLALEIEAVRGQVSAAISGHLLDAQTGSPLLGVSVIARQENGETIRSEKRMSSLSLPIR